MLTYILVSYLVMVGIYSSAGYKDIVQMYGWGYAVAIFLAAPVAVPVFIGTLLGELED